MNNYKPSLITEETIKEFKQQEDLAVYISDCESSLYLDITFGQVYTDFYEYIGEHGDPNTTYHLTHELRDLDSLESVLLIADLQKESTLHINISQGFVSIY